MTEQPRTARCPERCLGVKGHAGHHQTSDYDAIRREAMAQAAPDAALLTPTATWTWMRVTGTSPAPPTQDGAGSTPRCDAAAVGASSGMPATVICRTTSRSPWTRLTCVPRGDLRTECRLTDTAADGSRERATLWRCSSRCPTKDRSASAAAAERQRTWHARVQVWTPASNAWRSCDGAARHEHCDLTASATDYACGAELMADALTATRRP